MAGIDRTVDGNTSLADLQALVLRQEQIGLELISIRGITDKGVNFNQVSFDDKMPNPGPYSQICQTPPEPNLDGKTPVFGGDAFIQNKRVHIKVLR